MIKAKKNGTYYFCSAVAVRKKILLTAAHCLDSAAEILVFDKGSKLEIDSFKKHPNYNRMNSLFRNDIGVIYLSAELKAHKIYKIADFMAGVELTRVGFGGRNGKNERTVVKGLSALDAGKIYVKTLDLKSVSGDSGGAVFQKQDLDLVLVAIHSTIEGKFSLNPATSIQDPWLKSILEK